MGFSLTLGYLIRGALHLHTFCDFNCALFSHPNQEQLVIRLVQVSVSVPFSLMVLLNVVQSYFFKCAIHMYYAMDIVFISDHVIAWKVREHLP